MKCFTLKGRKRRTLSTPTLAPRSLRYSTVSCAVSPPEPMMIRTCSALGSPTYWKSWYSRPVMEANFSMTLCDDVGALGVEGIAGLAGLEEHVGVLRRAAQHGPVGVHGPVPVRDARSPR